jgi:translation elongation factor EF-Tu-like GTPase
MPRDSAGQAKGGMGMCEQEVEGRKVGEVSHYFGKISVAAIKLEDALKVGDEVRILGHTTDFTQTVDSMQIENEFVEEAGAGDEIGIKVKDRVRAGDDVCVI